MEKYNLIVAGGGLTGTAAAIAAARNGLKTLLVERGNALGGAAVNNLVNPFMQYWTQDGGQRKYLSGGFFAELISALKNGNGMKENDNMIFDEEYLKLLLNQIALQSGVSLLLDTVVIESHKENNGICGVTVFNNAGKTDLAADCFIDATGDAQLSAMSGVPFSLGREIDGLCQPMTLCFRIANIDITRFTDSERKRINTVYNEYKTMKKISNPREDVLIFKTMCPTVFHFNTTRVVKLNPVDGFDVTAAEIEARKQVYELFDMLKSEIAGFDNAIISATAAQIGIRESRRITGRHILTAQELKDCTVFDDSIAAGNYDIDIHNPAGTGTSHYYFKSGTYYTIPYRCLVPLSGADNLLVAGRCISATHEAQASIRIMPICCCLGEAAGTAAAVAAENGLHDISKIPVTRLQELLIRNGAVIR